MYVVNAGFCRAGRVGTGLSWFRATLVEGRVSVGQSWLIRAELEQGRVGTGPSWPAPLIIATGWLKNAQLPDRTKQPPIIPHEHPIAEMTVRYKHEKTAHLGREYVVSELRCRYWIVGVRGLVRQVLSRCVTCKRWDACPCVQQMANLPTDRVSPGGKTFTSVCIDYFGPIAFKKGRGREKG